MLEKALSSLLVCQNDFESYCNISSSVTYRVKHVTISYALKAQKYVYYSQKYPNDQKEIRKQ